MHHICSLFTFVCWLDSKIVAKMIFNQMNRNLQVVIFMHHICSLSAICSEQFACCVLLLLFEVGGAGVAEAVIGSAYMRIFAL